MNFSDLHERVRLEMLRRIENGSLTPRLLAHQIDVSPVHVSNFLNKRRGLSIEALDKVLRSQFLTVADLSPDLRNQHWTAARPVSALGFESVPLVDPTVAATSVRIPSRAIIDVLKLPSQILGGLRDKCSAERRKWDRLVAVQLWKEEAELMQPSLPVDAIAIIDRHYTSTFAYDPAKTTLYAVRIAGRMHFRYVTLLDRRLILRTHQAGHAPELIALREGQTSAEVIVGRVFKSLVDH